MLVLFTVIFPSGKWAWLVRQNRNFFVTGRYSRTVEGRRISPNCEYLCFWVINPRSVRDAFYRGFPHFSVLGFPAVTGRPPVFLPRPGPTASRRCLRVETASTASYRVEAWPPSPQRVSARISASRRSLRIRTAICRVEALPPRRDRVYSILPRRGVASAFLQRVFFRVEALPPHL